MDFWLRLAGRIDRFSEWTARLVYWLTLVAVVIGAFNAVARYLDRYTGLGLSSNTYIELQWYLFGLIFLLGAAYTLRRDGHVRVDVLFGKLSRKGQAWINTLGTVFFLFPFCFLMVRVSWPAVRNSWAVMEVSPDPGGLPRYPIKTIIPIAFILLALQGFSLLTREISVLFGRDVPDCDSATTAEGGHL
jgi:TRAP-type mannitol/chloroaromatic compound transport system permease small subunit